MNIHTVGSNDAMRQVNFRVFLSQKSKKRSDSFLRELTASVTINHRACHSKIKGTETNITTD